MNSSQAVEYRHPLWQSRKIHKPPHKPPYHHLTWYLKNPAPKTTPSLSFIMIGMMTRAKQDTPQWQSLLFQPVLKAYPTWQSWIITGHVSIGDLSKGVWMFNCQKALAQDLLIKLQQQPFASTFVFNTLLGEFSNIGNFYQLYEPIIWTAIQLLRNEPVMDKSMTSDNIWPKKSLLPFLGDALHWSTGMATQRTQQK